MTSEAIVNESASKSKLTKPLVSSAVHHREHHAMKIAISTETRQCRLLLRCSSPPPPLPLPPPPPPPVSEKPFLTALYFPPSPNAVNSLRLSAA